MGVRRQLVRQRVLVALTTGRQVSGIVMRSDREWVELADCQVVVDGKAVDVDGRMFVPAGRVDWLQRLPGRAGLG